MMVVFHHARLYFEDSADWTTVGAAGVDIFFVISGFIMAYATQTDVERGCRALPTAGDFLLKRAIRIVPLYWLALLWESKARFVSFSVDADIWKDFLFIPHYYAGSSGPIWPALMPGWTVNLEVLFYLVFGIAMLFGRAKILVASLVLMTLVSTRAVTDVDSVGVVLKFYSSGVVLEFVMGMLVFLVYARTRHHSPSSPGLYALLIAASLVLMLDSELPRFVADGIPAMLIVYAAVRLFTRAHSRLLQTLGDASYSIYLFHLAAFAAARGLIASIGLDTDDPLDVTLIVIIQLAVAAGVGVLVYYAVERPMLRWLRSRAARFASRPRPGSGTPSQTTIYQV